MVISWFCFVDFSVPFSDNVNQSNRACDPPPLEQTSDLDIFRQRLLCIRQKGKCCYGESKSAHSRICHGNVRRLSLPGYSIGRLTRTALPRVLHLPSSRRARLMSVFCSRSCALAEPVAGLAAAERLMLSTLRSGKSLRRRGTTNESAPMLAGSSCTHTISRASG